MSRQYYGIENLGLTAAQKNTLVQALQGLGDNTNPNPSRRNHWRIRLDNNAVIFEASFNDDDWTVEGIKNKIATILGVNASLVTSATAQTPYGPVVTYTRTTDRLRLVAFGGLLATYTDSQNAVLAYLFANAAAWGEVTA